VLEVIGGEARLSGAVVDPFWGEWSLEGGIDPIALTGRASLRTGPTRFDTPWLQAVPFIRPTVWQEVQLAGISPVDLALQFDLPARKWGYHIHTHPRQTTIHVRAIDLDVMEAEGPVDIEGGTLTLHNIQGQAAGGELRADAVLHCDGTPKRLNFALSASQLDLSRLPKTWHLPRLLTGNLSGKANLEVVVGKPKTVTSGKGRGVVANARVLGIPRKPINLELSAGPGGFRLLPAAEGSDTPVPFPPPGPE
jgi:hypothetical protein